MARKKSFVGFSTIDVTPFNKTWVLYDNEIIKRDLLNQFYTRRGERVMLPEYGSIIWDKLFDGLTDANRDAIVDDVTRIVNEETRVVLTNINVLQIEYGILIALDLIFHPNGTVDTLSVEFDTRLANRI